ncbi:MAG TPA: hypothetical protein VF223_02395 [Trebonia sp.]
MTAAELDSRGLERVWLWGRGVDTERFGPAQRDERLRAEIAPGGEVIVGYVARLGLSPRRLPAETRRSRRRGPTTAVTENGCFSANRR